MAAKGKASAAAPLADAAEEAATDEGFDALKEVEPVAGGEPAGVPVVALVTIYAPNREEPAAPGDIVMVDTDEAMTLIDRGHARLPTADETLPASG